ncbi:hypothetical protein CC78DRAFT_614950 [Lojkania enalia]|uniref:Uncharacterized protein n=1 Tax=Lojkania enalia TaxID=147567 RepID=A0A9P4KD15_9PLEO|nr:hypothetical protein CC78DRAFT_614950 [Didymosphaeria enalia]
MEPTSESAQPISRAFILDCLRTPSLEGNLTEHIEEDDNIVAVPAADTPADILAEIWDYHEPVALTEGEDPEERDDEANSKISLELGMDIGPLERIRQQVEKEHNHTILRLPTGRRWSRKLYQNTYRLLPAMRALWPETNKFKERDPYRIMQIVLANYSLVRTRIDPEVKDALIWTLYMEARLQLDPKLAVQKENIRAALKTAGKMKNIDEAKRWKRDKEVFDRELQSEGLHRLRDDIESARRDLYKKILGGMQNLVILEKTSAKAEARLDRAIRQGLDYAQGLNEVIEAGGIDVMQRLIQAIVSRLDPLFSRDLRRLDPETKEIIMSQRREMIRNNSYQMEQMAIDSPLVQARSDWVLCQLDQLDAAMQDMYEAARGSYQATSERLGAIRGCRAPLAQKHLDAEAMVAWAAGGIRDSGQSAGGKSQAVSLIPRMLSGDDPAQDKTSIDGG